MRALASLLLCMALAACASAPVVSRPDALFHDQLFGAPSERIDSADVFALSEEMRSYLKTEIAAQLRNKGPYRGLFDALYSRGQLQLEYDSAVTRNAAQAFKARSGNCLSLVIMTAAFAKELGLEVHYQSALTDEAWSRSGNLYLRSGHVNVTLGRRMVDLRTGQEVNPLKIDFLPPEELSNLRTRVIAEETIVAMYMNNRAAEALLAARLDDAYGWAREATLESPAFMSAFNTLGVVYWRHGDLAQAEQVFRYVLQREPANTAALSNLMQLLGRQGRAEESAALQRKLAQIQPYPPFHFFDLGLAALRRGETKAARDLFAKEVERDGYYHKFHFWLGVAHNLLGDVKKARKHLALAVEYSTTSKERELYAGKLAWIQSQGR